MGHKEAGYATKNKAERKKHIWKLALIFLISAILCINGWVAEDAYITFRVIDNFVNGYGLRWNIDERVQVFTHPLWLTINTPLYALTQNVVVTSITMSLLCVLAGIYALRHLDRSLFTFGAVLLLPLLLSHTLRDFLVSGMENPLSFALLAWFLVELLNHQNTPRPTRLCLIAALLLLTRLDHIFIILPALLWALWQRRKRISYPKLAAAFSPLIVWHSFSLFYYGFMFPNTKYAKLHAGISFGRQAKQSLRYFENFMYYDPVGFALILLFACMTLCAVLQKRASAVTSLLLMGCVLHLGYLVSIGGDMMSGRFMMNIILVSMVGLYVLLRSKPKRSAGIIAAAMAVLAALQWWVLQPAMPYKSMRHTYYHKVILDERVFYQKSTSMLHHFLAHHTTTPSHRWVQRGKAIRNKPGVYIQRNIGMFGYYAGPNAIIIDLLALTDPFLARRSALWRARSRPGHYRRFLPKGYKHARSTGDTSLMDEKQAKRYKALRLVTSGNLLDAERLSMILKFQLGYDTLQ